MCFGFREARGRQNKDFEKLTLCAPLKTKNTLISRDNYSRTTREWPARESQDSLYKILEESENHFHIFATWLWETLLAKMLTKEFFNKTDLAFGKNFQNTSDKQKHFQKQIKYSKIFLSLIIKQLSVHKSHLNTYNHTNEICIH